MTEEVKALSPENRAGYIRVSTNAQTRLTVSTFLGSICLSIFAVFLPNTFQLTGSDTGSILAVITEVLIGSACVLFLLITAAVSIVLIRLSDLNPSVRKLLDDIEANIQISEKDRHNLESIIKLYHGIYLINYISLGALLLCLPIVGFRINMWVGICILATLVLGFLYFFPSLGFVILYKSRNKAFEKNT